MLPRNTDDDALSLSWAELAAGAPSIIALAILASRALAGGVASSVPLSLHAQAILYAARERGSLELKSVKHAYDSAQRLLAVHVEQGPERVLVFRNRSEPQYTIALLDGFRELCAAGLVMHQVAQEFSLTHAGFAAAAAVDPAPLASLLSQAAVLDFEE